ncbi:hypothetical protein FZEAL_7183 [Fusarium zealandicum]|uniref:Uncharacterized protein n=1 Tax=Fusarium zealandicum TaxID=1053134 RepID=A0A8H4UGH2_9HYPO|nr:hypothetical protein FZEAL_7183 [Fusarium zealandicum]
MWSSPLQARDVPKYEPIDPEELKSRLGTTPLEHDSTERHSGMVYFCREENWGAPCFVYYPELDYACSELGPELKSHVGSVFVEPGVICRMATLNGQSRCAPTKIFAWPETQSGWSDLFQQQVPGGEGQLGYETTHFTCTKCTNCVRDAE